MMIITFLLMMSVRQSHAHIVTTIKGFMEKLDIPKLKYHDSVAVVFATRCIEVSCDYKTVSVLLGIQYFTTLDLYVHPNMEQKKRCITKVFKSLGK